MSKTKLRKLRSLFLENKINGYIISTRDKYLCEYPPAYSRRLEYLLGFTGSNGLAIILESTVLFFTDDRYFFQCSKELDQYLLQTFYLKELKDFSWNSYISLDSVIGYDPEIFTSGFFLHLKKKLKLKAIYGNLIDKIWIERPLKPNSKIFNYDITFTGETRSEKIARCHNFLGIHKADALVITNPEILCWVFNIRAMDTQFSPLLLANGYITKEKAYLFTDITRVHDKLPGITIMDENCFFEIIEKERGKILFDDTLCSKYISDIIKQKIHKKVENPCLLWKSCKNSTEINKIKEVHIQDAIAVIEFLCFLSINELSEYSEYDLGLKLTEFRKKGYNYVSDSFPAIIGFRENSAIIHYRAIKTYAKKIRGNGLLLIDSGGQYFGGTTDITRVMLIGEAKEEYRHYYTKVLKGHLSLAMIKFPKNLVTGANLDVLARKFLWYDGYDYPHSTGHGVGSFLSVHEGPQSISLNNYKTKFLSGMVISNEPGFYKPGSFGIRIENMMYVMEAVNPGFLEFKMLSLVPYERKLIKKELLTKSELNYLTNYYNLIKEKTFPYLSNQAKKWFKIQSELIL